MKYFLFALFLCLSCFACKKKELPLPVNGTPIFKFIGTIGNDSVNYVAGIDQLYMYSGFYKDSQNLITLKSYFAKDNCTNCEPYLSFEVKDFDVTNDNGLAGTIVDLLKGGGSFTSYSLDSIYSVTTIEQFNFYPIENKVGTIYNWNFGDGTTSSSAAPSHVFTGASLHDVRLVVQNGGLTDSLTNSINTDSGASNCRVQFTTSIDTLTNLVTVYASPLLFSTYAWNFGNGLSGSAPQDTTSYNSPGKYTITLTVGGGPACSSVFKQKVSFSSFVQTLANYGYQTTDTTITALMPRINKSAFVITWIKDGKVYRSFKNMHGINQSGNPVFTFTGIQTYQPNEHGEKTMLVTGTVDTYLFNKDNWQDSIKIKSNNIVLAAAYPD